MINIRSLLENYILNTEEFISDYDVKYIEFISNNFEVIDNNNYILDCHGLIKKELLYFLLFFDTLNLKCKLTLISGHGKYSFKKLKVISTLKDIIYYYYTKTKRKCVLKEDFGIIIIKYMN